MGLRPVRVDDNGHKLSDRGSQVGTERVTSVSTSGTALTLAADCKEVMIICDEGVGAWILIGTITGQVDECTMPVSALKIPVAVEAGETVCTLKAVSGTVNFSIITVR